MAKPMTYEDWKLAGYQVKKGEKSSARNKKGVPLFTRDQVFPVLDNPGSECSVCGKWGAACDCRRGQ